MSNVTRSILAALVAVMLAVTAFMAGFLTNDYLEQRLDISTNTASAASNGDMPIFQEAWSRIQQNFIGDIPSEKQIEYAAIRGSLEQLGDPYTIFIEPVVRRQEIDSLRGNFGGIGATLQRTEEGTVILMPIPGNPAARSGILPGDILLAVDGAPVTETMTVEEIADKIRGEKGTTVTLTIRQGEAAEPVDITIERDDILIPSVTARILEEDPDIGYIQLSRFSGESGNEVGQAIAMLQAEGAQQLILDLRHNGGGLLDAAVSVSDHFLQELPILFQETRSNEETTYYTTDETIAGDMPLVVLIDRATASASEIVAGALHDHDRAILIGSQTFGKGSVQLVYDLSDGSSVHVTSARWFTPEGHQIDQQGLEPDIVVELSQEDIDNGRDTVLERAVEYLQNSPS